MSEIRDLLACAVVFALLGAVLVVLLGGCATTGTGEWTQTDTNQAIMDGLFTVGDVLWMIFAH